MRRAFVTGATGFIGGHLVEELVSRGIQVTCLVRAGSKTDRLNHPLVRLQEGDLYDRQRLQQVAEDVDVVFHLGGLTHAQSSDDLFEVNGKAVGRLADAFARTAKPPRFVYLSSLAAAGPSPSGPDAQKESKHPAPISEYGRSKRAGEIELHQRAAVLPSTIIRPGIVFGPRDPGLASVFKLIYRVNLHVVIGSQTPPLGLIYVRDLARLLLTAAQHGECLNEMTQGGYSEQGYYSAVDDSEFPNYWQLGKRLGAILDRRVFVWPMWRWLGFSAASAVETLNRFQGRSSFFNPDKIREATAQSWSASCEKARRHLKFQPSDNLDAQLEFTANWYRDNNWL